MAASKHAAESFRRELEATKAEALSIRAERETGATSKTKRSSSFWEQQSPMPAATKSLDPARKEEQLSSKCLILALFCPRPNSSDLVTELDFFA